MRKIAILSFTFVSILCSMALKPETVYAGVGVSPANLEMVVPQGNVTKGIYTVVNDGDAPAHVKVEIEDWLKLRTGKDGTPIDRWLKLDPMEFDIGPKEAKEVEYTITPPKGQEGELIAMVYFGTSSPEGAMTITTRFGVSIYVAMENTFTMGCDIKGVSVSRDSPQEGENTGPQGQDVVFALELENTGNVHIRPTGEIMITGEGGFSDAAKVERNFPIYPGKRLIYGIPWKKKDLAPGKYEATVMLDYGKVYKVDGRAEKKIGFLVKRDGSVKKL